MENKEAEISPINAAELKQLQMIYNSYKESQNIRAVNQTVILYYVYQFKEDRDSSEQKLEMNILNNMNTFAYYILDNTLKVDVKISAKRPSYSLPKEELEKSQIQHQEFKIDEIPQYNIHSYTNQKGLRVVVFPIKKQLVSLKWKILDKQIQQEQAKRYHQFFEVKQNKQSQENRDKLKLINKAQFDKRVKIAEIDHLQTYKNQDLFSFFKEKTASISFIRVLQYKKKIKSQYEQILKQFIHIFQAPANIKPRLLVYYTIKQGQDSEQDDEVQNLLKFISKTNCAAHFTFQPKPKDKNKEEESPKKQEKKGFIKSDERFEVLDKDYFYDKSTIKLSLYTNLKNAQNKPIHQVMRQFFDNIRSITINTLSAIPIVFKNVNASLGTDSIIYKQQYKSFKTVDKLYQVSKVEWPSKSSLNNYYSNKRIGLIKQDAKKVQNKGKNPVIQEPVEISPSLNNLVFIHCFNKIKENALKQDASAKFNIEKRLQNWQNVFKDIFDLISSLFNRIKQLKMKNVSKAALQTQLSSSQKNIVLQQKNNSLVDLQVYDGIQNYYNFLCFVFKYIEKFHTILNEGAQFVDQFKAMMQSLSINPQKIIKYIIDHQQTIRSNEELIYYDLLQLLILQNKGTATRDKLDYIQCHILQLKAYQIASNYIYDEERIVQAIKAYASVALKFKDLPQTKKKLIKIQQIQIRISRLLNIIGQQEEAAKIYLQLKMFGQAHKLFNQIRLKHFGDSRAKKLIEWGNKFENEFQFQIALQFYRNAFDAAEQESLKVEAVKSKIECLKRRRREETEEEIRAYEKFISKGELKNFINQQQLDKIFQRMENLKWNSEDQCASFL